MTRLLKLFLLALAFGCAPRAEGLEWPQVRDGVVYVRTSGPAEIRCEWEEAWAADGHMETLFFQDPEGRLLERRRISFEEGSGEETFDTTEAAGDYRLEIPGRSYRYYTVKVPKGIRTVFEPVKHHHTANVPSGAKLYFKVPAGSTFSVCGKHHGGTDRIEVYNAKGLQGKLDLKSYGEKEYHRNDRITFDAQGEEGFWWLKMIGSGKAGFWLDGIANVFSLSPKLWFEPRLEPGQVRLHVDKKVKGETPLVGAMLPFAKIPQQGIDLLNDLKMGSANLYSFQETYKARGHKLTFHDAAWLKQYEQRLGIEKTVTIIEADRNRFKRKGKAPTASQADPYIDFVLQYLAAHRGENGLSVPYVAFMDEGNLRYEDAEAYVEFFTAVAEAVRRSPNPAVSTVKLAYPESSGFFNGPTKRDAHKRRGYDWLRLALSEHWELIDGIVWHEWMVRDLISTGWFAESVEAAWALQEELRPEGAAPKEIIIAQTNISSGSTVSPYEEDSFFAALWLGSVVAQAGGTGRLMAINWLPAFDDERHSKGLIAHDGKNGTFKPVAHGMRFLNENLLPHVLDGQSDSIEVDLLPTCNRSKNSVVLLIVNKAPRRQTIHLELDVPDAFAGKKISQQMIGLDASLKVKTVDEQRLEATTRFEMKRELEGETLYFVIVRAAS